VTLVIFQCCIDFVYYLLYNDVYNSKSTAPSRPKPFRSPSLALDFHFRYRHQAPKTRRELFLAYVHLVVSLY